MKGEDFYRALTLRAHAVALTAVTSLATVLAVAAQDAPSPYNAAKSGGIFTFAFRAATDARYDVEFRESLHNGPWTRLSSVLPGPSREVTITDAAAVTPSRFYRIASSEGAVYSVNVVGYVNVRCTPLTNLIAHQFFNAPNRITESIPTAPENTFLWKAGRLGPECAEFYDGAWRDCATVWSRK